MTQPDDNNNNNDPSPYIHDDPGVISAKTKDAGTKKMDVKETFKTKIRVTYLIPQSYTVFFPRQNHVTLLNELKKYAPELKVIPNDGSEPYDDMAMLPKTDADFEKHCQLTRCRLSIQQGLV